MTVAASCGPIIVVDDDASMRQLLSELLRHEGHAVRSVSSGEEAASLAEVERPALAVLDVCLPGISGYETCRRLRAQHGDAVPVLFLSGERTEAVDRVAGLLLGADDYMTKPFAPDELLARVAALLRRGGEAQPEGVPRLTRREHEVLELMADGLPHGEIARLLFISPKTVGTHVAHIYDKLDVRTRVQALAVCYRHRLLEPP